MTYPQNFTPSEDYSDFEAAHPNSPKPGASLDTDFNNIATSIESTNDFLQVNFNSDGSIKSGKITLDTIALGVTPEQVMGASLYNSCSTFATNAAASASAAATSAASASTSAATASAAAAAASNLSSILVSSSGYLTTSRTNTQAEWQAYMDACANKTALILPGTYVVAGTATLDLATCSALRIQSTGATIKLANGAIVNTDSSATSHVPTLRLQGLQYFHVSGVVFDGNKANQTYPASKFSFGRGTAPTRHNAQLEICADATGTTPPRNIFITECTFKNSYRSGCQILNGENINIWGNYTENNTWNGFGGAGLTDVSFFANKAFRDGVDSTITAFRIDGDRGQFQLRELPSTITTASEGIPIITTASYSALNNNIRVFANSTKQCQVVGQFLRACNNIQMFGNVNVDVGYQRYASRSDSVTITRSGTTATVTYPSAHNFPGTGVRLTISGADQSDYNGTKDCVIASSTTVTFTVVNTAATPATGTILAGSGASYRAAGPWIESCGGVIFGNISQATATDAAWAGVDGMVAYGFNGDGTSTIPMDGTTPLRVFGNYVYCGQDYNSGASYSANSSKKNLITVGIRANQYTSVRDNFIEGCNAQGVYCINDGQFSTERVKCMDISSNTFSNFTGSQVIRIDQFGSMTDSPSQIHIKDNRLFDVRGVSASDDNRAFVQMSTVFAGAVNSVGMVIEGNSVDLGNSADATKNYNFAILRGTVSSDFHVRNNQVRNANIFVACGRFAKLEIKDNDVDGCASPYPLTIAENSGVLDISGNDIRNITGIVRNFGSTTYTIDNLTEVNNRYSGAAATLFSSSEASDSVVKHQSRRGNFYKLGLAQGITNPLTNASGQTITARLPGVRFGDFLMASYSTSLLGLMIRPYVSAKDVVTYRVQNKTGSTQAVTAGNINTTVRKPQVGDIVTYSAQTPGTLTTGAGTTLSVAVPGAQMGDFVLMSYSDDLSLVQATGYVQSAGNVRVRLQNLTTTSQTINPGILSTLVIPKGRAHGLQGSITYDPSSLTTGNGEESTITVTGAQLGDYVMCSFSNDLQGMLLYGYVSAADTVKIRLQNETGGTLDLASGTLTACVVSQQASFGPEVN